MVESKLCEKLTTELIESEIKKLFVAQLLTFENIVQLKNYQGDIFFLTDLNLNKQKKIEEMNKVLQGQKSSYFYKYTYSEINERDFVNKKVGIICDEIMYSNFYGTTNLYYLNHENYLLYELDYVIYISTWNGLHNEYQTIEVKEEVVEIHERVLAYFKEQKIPIIFYSKEDPPNYDVFKPLAKYAQIVYTSSAERIANYRRFLGTNVGILQLNYPLNPSIHYPKWKTCETKTILFTGSWINHRFHHRRKFMEKFFKINNLSYRFIDRNFQTANEKLQTPNWLITEKNLAYNHVLEEYENYEFHLNLNSVENDTTMCALRVFELQAMMKTVYTNYSLATYLKMPALQTVFEFDQFKLEQTSVDNKIIGFSQALACTVYDFLNELNFKLFMNKNKKLDFTIINKQDKQLNLFFEQYMQTIFKFTDASTIRFLEISDLIVTRTGGNEQQIYVPFSENFFEETIEFQCLTLRELTYITTEPKVVYYIEEDYSANSFLQAKLAEKVPTIYSEKLININVNNHDFNLLFSIATTIQQGKNIVIDNKLYEYNFENLEKLFLILTKALKTCEQLKWQEVLNICWSKTKATHTKDEK